MSLICIKIKSFRTKTRFETEAKRISEMTYWQCFFPESLCWKESWLHFLFFVFEARANELAIEDMDGGTFTISNGGVFGSMMGTPIINPPQSSILGMHAIIDRPVAVNGKVSGTDIFAVN